MLQRAKGIAHEERKRNGGVGKRGGGTVGQFGEGKRGGGVELRERGGEEDRHNYYIE